jgi:hypothetical protein
VRSRHCPPVCARRAAVVVARLATDVTLAGRVLVWWSEDAPRLIQWGDRGFRYGDVLPLTGD